MLATKIHKEWRAFLAALTFYTRIPFPVRIEDSKDFQERSILYLPMIGWIVGGIAALVFKLSLLVFPQSVALLFSMVGTILLTGALHEDGFADSCDGFGGGWTKDEILTIMKDSRIGAYGMLGLVLLMGLKFFSLLEIESRLIPFLLIAAHSLSRLVAASLLYTHQYVGSSSSSKAGTWVKPLSTRELGIMALLGCLPLLLFMNFLYFLILLPLFVIQWALGKYFEKRIGGYTGDCLGATQQISEVVCYLTVLAGIS